VSPQRATREKIVNKHYYVIWTHPDGAGWEGPFTDIDTAKGAVPDGATALQILVPLPAFALTSTEARDAALIAERGMTR
jgi:hypothetical protein